MYTMSGPVKWDCVRACSALLQMVSYASTRGVYDGGASKELSSDSGPGPAIERPETFL